MVYVQVQFQVCVYGAYLGWYCVVYARGPVMCGLWTQIRGIFWIRGLTVAVL